MKLKTILAVGLVCGYSTLVWSQTGTTSYKFDFGTGPVKAGYLAVNGGTGFTTARGYGWDFGVPISCTDRTGTDELTRDLCYSTTYMYFSVVLPEGNYDVSVTVGDATQASTTTIKAESRRLFLEKTQNAAGVFTVHTFTVNRRNAVISTGGTVSLNDRERGGLNWDGNKLTFEFNNIRPSIAAMEITPSPTARQVFLAGNSTMCDWATETEAAWGQMFPRFFKQGTVVTNMAESGKTGASFIGDHRLDKIKSQIREGDYLFIEFAHNDMGSLTIAEYKANLVTMVTAAKAAKAIPVLVTPTPRYNFSGGKLSNSFGDYLPAMKQVATDQKSDIIDMNACMTTLLETLGDQKALKAYWMNGTTQDKTHFSPYGAYEVAKCVAEGVRTQLPELAANLVPDFTGFVATQPDPVDTWSLPRSADTSIWHNPPSYLIGKTKRTVVNGSKNKGLGATSKKTSLDKMPRFIGRIQKNRPVKKD
jgi:lysophospholipase L1-like esterase